MNPDSLLDRSVRTLRRFLPGGPAHSVLAVDVSPGAVRALHVRRDGTDLVLDGCRIARYTDDPAGQDLERAFRLALELRQGSEPIALCFADPRLTIRKIELPVMSLTELREALPWEARRHITDLGDHDVLDAQILANGGSGPMDVVLVAVPRDVYSRLADLWSRLGAPPEFVDVGPLATLNSLVLSGPGGGLRGLLDLERGRGSFAIFSPSELALFRDLTPRAERLDALLSASFALDPLRLEAFKESGRLPDGKEPTPEQVGEALADLVDELVEDVRSGLVYLENHRGVSLDRVGLTGTAGAFLERHRVAETISEQSGIEFDRYDPLGIFRLGLVDPAKAESASSELCAAAGVAARYFARG